MLEAQRIGYNDINQKYTVPAEQRRERLAAALQSLAYTFIQPNGAMRNTQNPHIVEVRGALAYSTGPAPAPLISPLNREFVEQMVSISESLNKIHAGRLVVEEFKSLAELVAILQRLVAEGDVYTPKA